MEDRFDRREFVYYLLVSIPLVAIMIISVMSYIFIPKMYQVVFDSDGGSAVESVMVEKDGKISKPEDPVKEGNVFTGWYYNDELYDFEMPVKQDMVLKAHWIVSVNTDDLLEIATKNIKTNEYYGMSFERDKKTLNIKVYDIHQKNSEISDAGLIESIVKILENEYVDSVIVEDIIFDKEDIKGNTTSKDSPIWDKFKRLLESIVDNKIPFEDITLGDLVDAKKSLNLTITLDEGRARSHNNNVKENYIMEFKYDPYATISLDIPDTEIQALESDVWNYTLEDTYTIEGENEIYKVQGSITEQDEVSGFSGAQKTGYYFAFSVRPAEIKDGLEIKIPKGNNEYNTFYKKDLVDHQLTVLFSIKKDDSSDRFFDIIVDLDGSSGTVDKPKNIRVDYSELELIDVYNVTFKYPNEDRVVKVIDGSKVTSPTDEPKEKYHEFKYWQKGKERYNFNLPVTQDIVLIPHWGLDLDKFIVDSASKFNVNEKMQGKINVSKSNHIMTYNVMQEKIPLTDFAESNFSDDIYDVLKKGEITEIDLKYDDNNMIKLTSEDDRNAVVSKISELLKQIAGTGDNATFDDLMNLDDNNFELIIAKYADNIELMNINLYEMDFVSDFRLVDNEKELNKAVANNKVKKVKLDADIPISNTITINRNVEIDGAEHTIDAKNEDNNQYVIIANHDGVIIHNIKLSNAKVSAILVETSGNVTSKNLDVSGSGEAGIEVHGKFTYKFDLDSEKLKYNEELYKNPTVRIPKQYKSTAVVDMNNSYRVDNYIKAIRRDDDFDDKLTYTGDIHYYTIQNNSRYYVIAFEDADRYKTYFRLRSYGEDIVLPKGGEKQYGDAVDMNIDGRNYIFDGWSTIRGYRGTNSGGKVTDFSDVTKGRNYQVFFYAINLPLN